MKKQKPLPQGIFLNYFTIPGLKEKTYITPDKILFEVCQYFDITIEQLKSRSRNLNFVHPRQVCCYIMRTAVKYHWNDIAVHVGYKEHSNALNAAKVIKNMIALYPVIKRQVDTIIGKLINGS